VHCLFEVAMLGAEKRRTVTRITASSMNCEENLKRKIVLPKSDPVSLRLVSACLLIATSGRAILFPRYSKEGVMKPTRVSKTTAETPATLLQPCDPEKLGWEMQSVQLAIARRAYELFEKRNREHGHDWEDWFRAESERLRPVSIMIHESTERVSLHANVFGFAQNELLVSIEPKRVAILGQKEVVTTETGSGKIEYIDWYPDQILRVIDLPLEIDPEGAVIELQTGLLRFELPKAVKQIKEAAAAAGLGDCAASVA
jgi:HSP20 family molecular chaperone IbpA